MISDKVIFIVGIVVFVVFLAGYLSMVYTLNKKQDPSNDDE